jgi:hypothetical protein
MSASGTTERRAAALDPRGRGFATAVPEEVLDSGDEPSHKGRVP